MNDPDDRPTPELSVEDEQALQALFATALADEPETSITPLAIRRAAHDSVAAAGERRRRIFKIGGGLVAAAALTIGVVTMLPSSGKNATSAEAYSVAQIPAPARAADAPSGAAAAASQEAQAAPTSAASSGMTDHAGGSAAPPPPGVPASVCKTASAAVLSAAVGALEIEGYSARSLNDCPGGTTSFQLIPVDPEAATLTVKIGPPGTPFSDGGTSSGPAAGSLSPEFSAGPPQSLVETQMGGDTMAYSTTSAGGVPLSITAGPGLVPTPAELAVLAEAIQTAVKLGG